MKFPLFCDSVVSQIMHENNSTGTRTLRKGIGKTGSMFYDSLFPTFDRLLPTFDNFCPTFTRLLPTFAKPLPTFTYFCPNFTYFLGMCRPANRPVNRPAKIPLHAADAKIWPFSSYDYSGWAMSKDGMKRPCSCRSTGQAAPGTRRSPPLSPTPSPDPSDGIFVASTLYFRYIKVYYPYQ
jgi:hypothetical protein